MARPQDDGDVSDSDQSFHSLPQVDTEAHAPNSTQHPVASSPKPSKKATLDPSADPSDSSPPATAESTRFPPSEEASLLTSSNTQKTAANTLFITGSYENALQTYDQALATLPNYLDYEVAILRSNISACNLKLQEWQAAADAASKGIECLERLEPLPELPRKVDGGKEGVEAGAEGVEEVDEGMEARIAALKESGHTLAEVRKLQTKLLLRRARAKTMLDGWANLQAAEEDYRILLTPSMQPSLSPTDKRTVLDNARALGPKLNAAKDREMAEMMGKLKGLGNSVLKPFGLSTENFQFVKDEKTGGYSMNFDQSAGSKK